MKPTKLECINCKNQLGLGIHYYCPKCGFPLEVIFSCSEDDKGNLYSKIGKGIWKYNSISSLVEKKYQISLGEGDTTLLQLKRLDKMHGTTNLFVKNEGQNPTGSFKDRPTSLGISYALSQNIDHVIISSTGNAGGALSAYAAAAGLTAIVLVPQGIPQEKLTQIAIHGAKIVLVRGSVSDSLNLGREISKNYGWLNLTSTFLNPYPVVANRTVAFEIFEEMKEVPDWIVVPVGVGPLLVGIYRGFEELKQRNITKKLPRMVAAQAEQCAPIFEAFLNDSSNVREWTNNVNTIASGISDPLIGYENDGTFTLRIVKDSKGIVTKSSEKEIRESCELLANQEGIFCEPTSAVAHSALSQIRSQSSFKTDQSIVLILTGHGLKQQTIFSKSFPLNDPIEATLTDFDRFYFK